MSVIVLVQERQSASHSGEGILSHADLKPIPKIRMNENNLLNFTFYVLMKYFSYSIRM